MTRPQAEAADDSETLVNFDLASAPEDYSSEWVPQTLLVFDTPPPLYENDESHEPIDVCACLSCCEAYPPSEGNASGGDHFEYVNGLGGPSYVAVQASLDPSSDDSGLVGTNDPGNGKPIWAAYQTAQHIARSGLNWTNDGDMVVTYRFADATTAGDPNWVFEPVNQEHTRSILQLFAEVTGVTFVEVTSFTDGVQDDADITFRYRDGSNGGGYWDGSNVVVSRVSWEPEMLPGTYNFRLMVHEIGHAMGLSHPGPYNGDGFNYDDHADHWNDSYQYTSLSYWNETETGAQFGHMATLGLHDILALQIEYGTDWTTRDDDTVYGYNQTTGLDSYDLTYRSDIAFSIWDGGGVDTLDFSGSSQGTELDLREGAFSSVNGQVYNVSIAYGAIIENGVGSDGDDLIIGNGVGNHIKGGAGNDVMTGGAEAAPGIAVDPRHFTGFELNNDPLERDQYLSITDLFTMPTDAITLEMMVDVVRMPSGGLILASYGVTSNSNEFLVEGLNGGNLRIHIDGAFYDTAIPTVSLIDGEPHRLSLTWDSATGMLNVYVDGELAESATFQQGAQIAAGGTLVFGQEQDVEGGGFSTTQIFSGTMGDIRLFDTARSAEQIADDAFATLNGNEAGLVHNWRVQPGDTMTVTDFATNTPLHDLTNLRPDLFTASQSSNPYSNTPTSNALDDDLDSFTHTSNSGDEWLEIDFAQPMTITHVELVNRNGWESRLDGAVVSVLDANGDVLHTFPAVSGLGRQEALRLELPGAMVASAVRIDQDTNFLHLGEVNIYGTPPVGTTIPPRNSDLALTGAATVRDTAPVVDLTPDNDFLDGEDGDDDISGGWGNDTLIGGRGADTLDGGEGDDILRGEGPIIEPPATAAIDMIRLNQDYVVSGAAYDDHQLRADASLNLPATAFTFEAVLRTEGTLQAWSTLVAATTGGEWDTQEFTIRVDGFSTRIDFIIAGQTYRSSLSKQSFDGPEAVRLSVSWESANGALNIYLDGVLVESATLAQGETLSAGMNFYIGSGWDKAVDLSVGDIRIWDSVRTEAEIFDAAFAPLGDPANTAGLVHNWRVDPGDLTALADAVGGPVALAIQNVTPGNQPSAGLGDYTSLFSFDDILDGGEGDDILDGGRGDDVLRGGAGIDTASYASAGGAVTVSLNLFQQNTGGAGIDTLVSIENLIGSAFGDTLDGSNANNRLEGGDGGDTLRGFGGADTLVGGTGVDLLNGGGGNDILIGDGGGDTIYAGRGDDTVSGGSGDDVIEGDDGADVIDAGIGNDEVRAGSGTDTVFGGEGIDTLFGQGGEDFLSGGGGNDDLRGGGKNDVLNGDSGDDTLFGERGEDILNGGDGNDTLSGADEADILNGGAGNDSLNGGAAIDTLNGGTGNDELFGGGGNDTLNGDDGQDQLLGEAGNDTLNGGAGFDRLNGGEGFDVLTGGADTDWFILTGTNFDNDRITDFEDGVDRIVFRASTGITEFADINDIRQAGNDVVIETDAGNIRLENTDVADITEADFIFG